jgi:hypothetical protein
VEAGHSLNSNSGFSLYSAFYWKSTNNAIESLSTVDTNGVSFTQPQNIARRQAYGLNLYMSTQFNNQVFVNGGWDVHYQYLNSPALSQQNSGIVWNANLNCTYTFAENYALQANGTYTSGQISVQGTQSAFYWYGFSARRQFWKKKASLTLTGNNVFNRGVKQTGKQLAPTFYTDFSLLSINRSVQLTFEWRFGQMNAQGRKNKKISNDDKSGH